MEPGGYRFRRFKNYFEAHKADYWWKPGAEAIIFNTANVASAHRLKNDLESNIKNWRRVVDSWVVRPRLIQEGLN